jgi:hypothetical protein
MLKVDRSRLVRWRLGWLPGGKPKPCRCGSHLTKTHVIRCLHLHARLSIGWKLSHDPLSFLVNRLPSSPPTSLRTFKRWTRSWPIMQQILLELEYLQHPDHSEPLTTTTTEDPFLTWLARRLPPASPSPPCSP